MANPAKIRALLETLHRIAPLLNDKEISDIGIVLLGALSRIEKEGEKNDFIRKSI
jgi:hypothetical protein